METVRLVFDFQFGFAATVKKTFSAKLDVTGSKITFISLDSIFVKFIQEFFYSITFYELILSTEWM